MNDHDLVKALGLCNCERVEMRRPSRDCPEHGRDCYECGRPVAEGEGEQHGRAGFVHYACNE